MTHTTGRWLFGYGVALLIFAVVLMANAETEIWQVVALVVALLGGFGLGTGMAVMMVPGENDEIDVHYDDPMRTPPTHISYPTWTVCLSCGKPGCTGEPCVNS